MCKEIIIWHSWSQTKNNQGNDRNRVSQSVCLPYRVNKNLCVRVCVRVCYGNAYPSGGGAFSVWDAYGVTKKIYLMNAYNCASPCISYSSLKVWRQVWKQCYHFLKHINAFACKELQEECQHVVASASFVYAPVVTAATVHVYYMPKLHPVNTPT